MLSHLLEPLLVASSPSRIVNVVSAGQAPVNFDDTLRLITDPALEAVSGRNFDQAHEARALAQAYDERARHRLRAIAERLTGAPSGHDGIVENRGEDGRA
jgi:hypothetical protein